MTEITLENWIGRGQTAADRIDLARVKAMEATLDLTDSNLAEGSALPYLWHWLYFWEHTSQQELAADGHAKRGSFLPPVALPRRMWAAGELAFHSPLPIGHNAERRSRIESIEQKQGKSGQLAFVTVAHEIANSSECYISEKQTIVYREAASQKQIASPPGTSENAPKSDYSQEVSPNILMLFRYSALTFNAHRIHYDRAYVTEDEGYPGLLVHGPLLATLLANLATQQNPGAELASFKFRALKPVFDLAPFRICGRHPNSKGEIELFVADSDQNICMQATAKLKS